MRRFLACLLLSLGFAPSLATAGPSFEQLQAQALEAYKGKHYAQMEDLLRQAEKLRPSHPRALYNLAAGRALQGDGAGAAALLARLDRMKLAYKFWEDPDFSAFKDKPEFQKLAESFRRYLAPQGKAYFAFDEGWRAMEWFISK